MTVEIKFCGAAGVVTGSSYLVSAPQGKFLIDCGMFQGTKTIRELNYGDFGFDPSEISFVLLTHAHIDHSGLLPKLVKEGFTGEIFATEATKDLLEYMLPDSASIQESEVRRLNKKNEHRGLQEVSPIYTMEDAEQTLQQIASCAFNKWVDLPLKGIQARFWNAGHILGSASIEIKIQGGETPVHILFSGDLGPDHKSLATSPESPNNIDYLVVESTYGDRIRGALTVHDRRQQLKREILDALMSKGNIIIPSFAVERTQELLLDLDWLMDKNELPAIPLFIDSPLATKVTGVFKKHNCLQDGEECPFHGQNVRYIQSVEESKALARIKSGAIIMSASGMCEAGRIRYHLRDNLWNPKATVLFVGYQAEGTLGKFIQTGAKRVRIHGEEVDVKARIRTLDCYSAHADQSELVAWVKSRLPVLKNIFLTHGTEDSRMGFEQKLASIGVHPSSIIKPMIDDKFRLGTASAAVRVISSDSPRITKEQMGATDWHNDYARLVLDLAETLRNMKSSGQRHALLNNLMNQIYKNGHAEKK